MRDTTTTNETPLLDVDACARFLGASRATVYRLVAEGRLPAFRLRDRLRFDPDEIRAALREPPA
jgi:excisionase family DNA binding protein